MLLTEYFIRIFLLTLTHCCICLIFIYLWLHWVFVAACGLSLFAENGGYSPAVVLSLLLAVSTLLAEQGIQAQRLQ